MPANNYRLTNQQRRAASDARTLYDLEMIVNHIKETKLVVDEHYGKKRIPSDVVLSPISDRADYERQKQFNVGDECHQPLPIKGSLHG